MAWALAFLDSFRHMLLELAPWLLVGLVAAGLIQALLPMQLVARWLGGRGIGATLRAAILGAPLPLCSCSVLPAATSLRRRGASRSATASFLVSTPETGVDSIAVSYSLLGPFMVVARVVSAVVSAVCVGLLVGLAPEPRDAPKASAASTSSATGCCSGDACCDSASAVSMDTKPPLRERITAGLRFATTTLFDDLLLWLFIGLVAAAAVHAFAPPDLLARFGSGLPAKLVMLFVGVPTYICATASTPLAAALLAAGVSPGTVLVFLLAGPATSLATIGVVRRELGNASSVLYLLGLAICSVGFGVATDAVAAATGTVVSAQVAGGHEEVLPLWIAGPAVAIVVALAGWSVARRLLLLRRRAAGSTTAAIPLPVLRS